MKSIKKEYFIYEAIDGKQFDNKKDCLIHEKKIRINKSSCIDKSY